MGVCKHRREETCKYTYKPCYGFRYNRDTKQYEFDTWKERRCPYYEDSEPKTQPPPPEAKISNDMGGKVVIRVFGANTPYVADEDDPNPPQSLDTEVEILQGLLKRRYGDAVIVEGVDVNSRRLNDFPEVKAIVSREPQVVVTINDEIKFIGSIPLPHIKRELEKLGISEKQ